MSDSPVILALDSSTTATKAIAFDLDGHAVAEARRDYPRNTPRPGWQEQDATDWWRAAAEARKPPNRYAFQTASVDRKSVV